MPSAPRFVLVTGLSGSGKSQALRIFEDLGFYCVNNLPPSLITTFAELLFRSNEPRQRVAVCVDARSGDDLTKLPEYLDAVAEYGVRPDALFLDSSDDILVSRYSESRRRHPLAPTGRVEEGIRKEREVLQPVRARADFVLDTSTTSLTELRERIAALFLSGGDTRELVINVMSFGFKFGIPPEADLVLDVRFLPNPFYDKELRPLTGEDPAVRDFVLDNPDAREFMERFKGLLKFLIPRYIAESKSYLTIAVGCTGGRHRSVAVAHSLLLFLRDLKYNPRLRHRDAARPVEGQT